MTNRLAVAAAMKWIGKVHPVFAGGSDSRQMKRSSFVFILVATAGAAVGGRRLITQHHEATALRVQRETLRLELAQFESAKAENLRLRALQIPRAELEVMRADHAALP